eukprot:8437498-Alexandrium_andersonii.AAC.1
MGTDERHKPSFEGRPADRNTLYTAQLAAKSAKIVQNWNSEGIGPRQVWCSAGLRIRLVLLALG